MTHKMLAGLAGALLMSTAGLALAQGTTIVPAGQSASDIEVAQNDDTGTTQTEQSGSATSKKSGSSDNSDATASEGAGSGETEAAKSSDGGGSSSGDGDQMQAGLDVDAHPSADTVAEGNAVSETNPADADQSPGLSYDPAGNPVYDLADGAGDWYTWRGYKKYGANCLQCHGPDGMGSSFAPNLTQSLQDLSYYDFAGIIVSGQQNKWNSSGNSIMPAWGEDPNVMCSLDAIYVYLRGRTDGVVGRGEPKRPEKTDATKAAQDQEYSCLGF